jgi:phosphate transport system permease protein
MGMQTSTLILALLVLTGIAYQLGRARSLRVAGGPRGARKLHSLPAYYGLLTAIWCGLPALAVVTGWQALEDRVIDWIT